MSTLASRADARGQCAGKGRAAGLAQSRRPLAHELARHLRHARGGRAGPRAEGKDVEIVEPGFRDEAERAREHRLVLGRKAGDEIGAERDARPQRPRPRAPTCERIGARVPALHALQDQIVAGLERQMQMRHQPRLARR